MVGETRDIEEVIKVFFNLLTSTGNQDQNNFQLNMYSTLVCGNLRGGEIRLWLCGLCVLESRSSLLP